MEGFRISGFGFQAGLIGGVQKPILQRDLAPDHGAHLPGLLSHQRGEGTQNTWLQELLG